MPTKWGPRHIHGDETLDWSRIPLIRLLNELLPQSRLRDGGLIGKEIARRINADGLGLIYRELRRSVWCSWKPALSWNYDSVPEGQDRDPRQVRLGYACIYMWARVVSASDDPNALKATNLATRLSKFLDAQAIRDAETRARSWVASYDLASRPDRYRTAERLAAYEQQVNETYKDELKRNRERKLDDPEWASKLEAGTLKKIEDDFSRVDGHLFEIAWHAQRHMDQYLDRPFRRVGRYGLEEIDKTISLLKPMVRPGGSMVSEHPLFKWHPSKPSPSGGGAMTFPWIEYQRDATRIWVVAAWLGLMGYPTRIWRRDWWPRFRKDPSLLDDCDLYTLTAWFYDCDNNERVHDGLLATVILNGDLIRAFERARSFIQAASSNSPVNRAARRRLTYGYAFKSIDIPECGAERSELS